MALGSTDLRGFWPSTAASIPANWTRDTAFDDRYWQGSTSAGTNGGGNHQHTSSAHTHTGNEHVHSTSAGTSSSVTSMTVLNGALIIVGSLPTHTHDASDSASAVITYSSTAVTTSSDRADPPFFRCIVIAPDDVSQDVPTGAVVFTDETSITGFSVCDGVGGTPNMDDRFVLGAAAAGDGGGTGGSATHIHTDSGHAHTPTTHSHSSVTAGISPEFENGVSSGARQAWDIDHQTIALVAAHTTPVSTESATFDATSSEPAWTKLLTIQNTGSAATPDGIIMACVGTTPANWIDCDGTGGTLDLTATQIKCTTATGEIGDTGGANSHTHDSPNHTHTDSSHTHSESVGKVSKQGVSGSGGTKNLIRAAIDDHGHTWTVAGTTATMQNATFTTDSADTRAPYRTVKFVKRLLAAGFAHSWGTVI